MLFSKQLNYYTTIEKVLQVLQYFAKVVILRRARSFCGALFKRIFAWKRGISKRQFIEIVSLLVVLHLSYSKYEGVKYFFTRAAIKIKLFHSCHTRLVRVAFVSQSCRSCSTRVALVSHSCLTYVASVAFVSLVSGTRVVNQTRLNKTVPAFFLIMSYSFFIAIIRQTLRAYFASKLLKVDYSKNI